MPGDWPHQRTGRVTWCLTGHMFVSHREVPSLTRRRRYARRFAAPPPQAPTLPAASTPHHSRINQRNNQILRPRSKLRAAPCLSIPKLRPMSKWEIADQSTCAWPRGHHHRSMEPRRSGPRDSHAASYGHRNSSRCSPTSSFPCPILRPIPNESTIPIPFLRSKPVCALSHARLARNGSHPGRRLSTATLVWLLSCVHGSSRNRHE